MLTPFVGGFAAGCLVNNIGAFVAGCVVGGVFVFAACLVWAFNAMKEH